jgi:hypothetical protein
MGMITSFEKIAPFLKDPLVLIGFFLLVAFSFCRYVVKKGVIPPLPRTLGYRILRLILLYGFIIGLLLVVLGYALKRQELIERQRASEKLDSMVQEVLSHAPWLSEEKRNVIIQQIVDGYRTGILSKEQAEEKVGEIKDSLTPPYRSPPAVNQFSHHSEPGDPAGTTNRSALSTANDVGRPPSMLGPFPDAVANTGYRPIPALSKDSGKPGAGVDGPIVGLLSVPTIIPRCAVKIDTPEPGAKVNGTLNQPLLVRGTASIPAGTQLWIFTSVKGRNDFRITEGSSEATIKNGKWESRVGLDGEMGVYQIVAVVLAEQTVEDWREKIHAQPSPLPIELPGEIMFPLRSIDIIIPNSLTGCPIAKVEVEKVNY